MLTISLTSFDHRCSIGVSSVAEESRQAPEDGFTLLLDGERDAALGRRLLAVRSGSRSPP